MFPVKIVLESDLHGDGLYKTGKWTWRKKNRSAVPLIRRRLIDFLCGFYSKASFHFIPVQA